MKHIFMILLFFGVNAFAKSEPVYLNSQIATELSADDFKAGIESLKNSGHKQIIFENNTVGFQRVSMSSSKSSGDFYIMMGLEFNDINDQIRQINYFNLQSIVQHMSGLNFRVIMNLYAGISDLKDALKAEVPTIILWTSHGDPTNFYSATGEPIPASVFNEATPHVYQFILSACYGAESIGHKYRKTIPSSIRTYSWSGTTKPSELNAWIKSPAWNAFSNRKDMTNEGLKCALQPNSKYALQAVSKNKLVPGYNYRTANECYESLLAAREGFVCNQTGAIDYATVSISTLQLTPGSKYSSLRECTNRLKSAYNKKMCRGLPGSSRVVLVSSQTNMADERYYTAMPDCVNALLSERSL